MRADELTELQLDALREIGAVGAGHGATALAELVRRTLRIEVPSIEVIDITRMPYAMGSPQDVVGAVYARLGGELAGGLLCAATPQAVRSLIELLGDVPAAGAAVPDERLAGLLVGAMGHIIEAYLAAVSEMTGLRVNAVETSWAYDMSGALLEAVVSGNGSREGSAVFVRTAFLDAERSVEVALFFVPDPESLLVILGRLGLA